LTAMGVLTPEAIGIADAAGGGAFDLYDR